jgi:Fe-S-cluster-containing dehydrogenase component
MAISRRDLLKSMAAGGGLVLASGALSPLHAAMPKTLPPQAVGLLYDATLCVGCKSCMVSCKEANSVPGGALYHKGKNSPSYVITKDNPMWDMATDLSGDTVNVIKVYRNGTGLAKDSPVNGYSFLKKQCLHCISPACASVCPAGALRKDPVNGVVYYIEGKCIGCRYCQLACPFCIPQYEWDTATPQVRKCQLCNHRYKEGKYSACAETCPTGATVFGRVVDLRREARRRLAQKPGSEYEFPIQRVDSVNKVRGKISRYVNHIYGLKEAGGTQSMMLAGVPFELLGFTKDVPDEFLPELTWAYIKKIPAAIVAVLVGGTAVWAATHRKGPSEGKGGKS